VIVANASIGAVRRDRDEPAEPITVHHPGAGMAVSRRLALVLLAAGVAVRVAPLLVPGIWFDEATTGTG
jgi:hypothetical protein